MTPNATTNGTHGPMFEVSSALTARYDCVPVTVPGGRTLVSAARSARMLAAEPALRNRYIICAAAGVPGARSLAISLGTTQPPAELLTELATPTTVSTGFPGRLARVSRVPSVMVKFEPGLGSLDRTSWPGRVAQ